MKYDFDEIIDRRGTYSLKWDKDHNGEKAGPYERLNSLWVADMDFPCPAPVMNALMKRAGHPVYGYTYYDNDELSGIASGWYENRYGWDVKKEDILFSPGVVASINYAINALTKPGEGVIIQPPVYYPFRRIVEKNGRRLVFNPLKTVEGVHRQDFGDLESKASEPGNTMMILCSPHNPGGRVWTRDELSRISDICKNNGVILVSDEIHADLVRKDSIFTPAAKAGHPENTITCTAPSKTFNIPGLMISSAIIENDGFKEKWKIEAYAKAGLSMPNPFGAEAFKAAYLEGGDWLEQVNSYIDANLEWLKVYVSEELPGVVYRVPEGTYLAWLDISGAGWDNDAEFSDILAEKTGVLVDPGHIFGPGGGGHIRLNVACPRSRLEDALEKIKSVL